jgi:hypothetical protein
MKVEIGSGFVGTLTIVLVILKALGYISWSWWWVFSPIWISALVILGILIVVLLVVILFAIADAIWG